MLFGFWSWVLVIIAVTVIFVAHRLPELHQQAKEQLKSGAEALKKSQQNLQEKINKKVQETKKAAEEKKKAKAAEEDDDDDEEELQ